MPFFGRELVPLWLIFLGQKKKRNILEFYKLKEKIYNWLISLIET